MIINIYFFIKKLIPNKIKAQLKFLIKELIFYRRAIIVSYIRQKLPKSHFNYYQRPIKILILLPQLTYGGVESITYDLINGLDNKRYKIYIGYTFKQGERYTKFTRLLKGRIFSLTGLVNNFENNWSSFEKLIKRVGFDIILFSNNQPLYFLLPYLRLLSLRVKIINWLHCDTTFFEIHKEGYRKYSSLIDKTIVVNNRMMKFLIKKRRLAQDKVLVIHDGVDTRIFNPQFFLKKIAKKKLNISDNDCVIGFVGRLEHEKSPLDFINLAKLVYEKKPNVKFLVVGDGKYREHALKYSRLIGINKHIIFLGNINNVAPVMAAIDILVSTSISEGFGLAIVEAMSMKIPIVAYKVGGIPEIVLHERNGFLAEPHNIKSLMKYVIRLINDPILRINMGNYGREIIMQRFDIKNTTYKMSSLFCDVVYS